LSNFEKGYIVSMSSFMTFFVITIAIVK